MDTEHLMIKLLTNEASTEDMLRWEKISEQHPELKKEFEKMQKIWLHSERHVPLPTDMQVEKALQNTWHTLHSSPAAKVNTQRWQVWKVAAMVMLALGIGFALWAVLPQYTSSPEMVVVKSENLSKERILSDGSTVVLEQGSEISFPSRFDKNQRRVKLGGTAFFEVSRDEKKPFVIEAGRRAEVQVLGTSFQVKTDSVDNVQVWVKSGKVKLRAHPGKEIVLLAGDQGQYYAATDEVLHIIPESHITSNKLVFADTEIQLVVQVLSEYFHTEIVIAEDEIKSMKLNATYTNEDLETILDLIKETLALEVVKNGKKYILTLSK